MSFDKYEQSGAYHWRETDRRSRDYNPPLVARYEVLLDAVGGEGAVDVGAGDGYLSARLADLCEWVIALEYDQAGARLAAEMLAGWSSVNVLRGDSYRLPLADRSVPQLVMADVIEHLDDAPGAVLA